MHNTRSRLLDKWWTAWFEDDCVLTTLYNQESGRAGRDGLPSDCVLFYAPKDFASICNMLRMGKRKGKGRDEKQQALLMKAFCENTEACRRVSLLRYIGPFASSKLERARFDLSVVAC